MNIVLLGPPGVGKGTQAERLKENLSLPHVSSGDMFRALVAEKSPLAEEIRSYMDRGDYVPDGLTIELVLRRLDEADARNGVILDGFPRTVAQADALERALAESGRHVEAALYITAPREVLIERVAGRIVCPHCGAIYNRSTRPPRQTGICDVCGHAIHRRSDEDVQVVTTRLDTYVRQTKPLVDYYREHGLLMEIDGSRPMEEVEANVDAALGIPIHQVDPVRIAE